MRYVKLVCKGKLRDFLESQGKYFCYLMSEVRSIYFYESF